MSKREFGVFLYGVGPERVYMRVSADSAEEAARTTEIWLEQKRWQELETGTEVIRIRSEFVSRIEIVK